MGFNSSHLIIQHEHPNILVAVVLLFLPHIWLQTERICVISHSNKTPHILMGRHLTDVTEIPEHLHLPQIPHVRHAIPHHWHTVCSDSSTYRGQTNAFGMASKQTERCYYPADWSIAVWFVGVLVLMIGYGGNCVWFHIKSCNADGCRRELSGFIEAFEVEVCKQCLWYGAALFLRCILFSGGHGGEVSLKFSACGLWTESRTWVDLRWIEVLVFYWSSLQNGNSSMVESEP